LQFTVTLNGKENCKTGSGLVKFDLENTSREMVEEGPIVLPDADVNEILRHQLTFPMYHTKGDKVTKYKGKFYLAIIVLV
jgi:hypothetical protein